MISCCNCVHFNSVKTIHKRVGGLVILVTDDDGCMAEECTFAGKRLSAFARIKECDKYAPRKERP